MTAQLIAIEAMGWAATAVFIASYFCPSSTALRSFQMIGALMWVAYGALIGALPVITANVLVFTAAAWTIWRGRLADSQGAN